MWFTVSFPLAACAIAVASVIAWFHGERGEQQSSLVDWILLSAVGVVWVSITVWIVI